MTERPKMGDHAQLLLRALDGRDGSVPLDLGGGGTEIDPNDHVSVSLALADFGRRRSADGMPGALPIPASQVRVVVLDAQGRETAERELGNVRHSSLVAVDLTGDGRDELVLNSEIACTCWGTI